MLVSVCTPTHSPQYLLRCWDNLKQQTHTDFEWIVVPNGKYRNEISSMLRGEAFDDPRIKIILYNEDDDITIGGLKRFAFMRASGEVMVEFDHDDQLATTCLEEVAKVAHRHPNSFIYSDSFTCRLNGHPELFDKNWGWEWYATEIPGFGLKPINKTHPITPRSLCEILFAPDHVRAWTKYAYEKAGYHNISMEVADDHELIIRTYLAGIPFVKIDTPMYVHYWDNQSTSREKVELIQKTSLSLRDKYLHSLVEEWCRREGLRMIDLGGAHGCPPKYTPLDTNPTVRRIPGAIHGNILTMDLKDLENVGCYRAFDFLEHIPSVELPALMNRLYDSLVPGGWILSKTPSICDSEGRVGRGAFQDPTHVSFWSVNNWWYYTDRNVAKYIPEYRGRFQGVRMEHSYPSEWHKNNQIPYVIADVMKLDESIYQPGPKLI